MDISPEFTQNEDQPEVANFEEVVLDNPSTEATTEPTTSSLAGRIGHNKVYVLPDADAARAGKRKREEEYNEEEQVMEDDVSDPMLRDNAILFHGIPISHLPTKSIFNYALHFDAHPNALEWIDDTTCVLVFPTRAAAKTAFRVLTKSYTEEPSDEGFITAKPIPVTLWPKEKLINKSLGVDEGLKGAVRMRYALASDQKKRGAKNESGFYKKYGESAGKEGFDMDPLGGPSKRRRGGAEEETTRAQLDDELDAFLKEDDPGVLINEDDTAEQRVSSEERIISGQSKLRGWNDEKPRSSLGNRLSSGHSGRGRGSRGPRNGRSERPKKTQEDLDAELDAFLNSRD